MLASLRSSLLLATLLSGVVVAPAASQVTKERDLAFGPVITGTTTSVSVTGTQSARWRIHINLLSAGNFRLTLPTTLTRSGGGGSMSITFCSTCGVYRINNSNPSGGTTFNPANTVSFGLQALNTNIYVWLGASVSPPLNQPAGSYSGTVVLTTSGFSL
jgi:hypothetical protein